MPSSLNVKPQSVDYINTYPVVQNTREEIKEYLMTYLKGQSNWDEIDKIFNGAGTLDFMIDLLSVTYEVNNFNALRSNQESFIEFAQLDRNIFDKAKELGFRINRKTAPVIQLRYIDRVTITLYQGTKLGTYEDYDVIYWGTSKLIEYGDFIYVKIGVYSSDKIDIVKNPSEQEDIVIDLMPDTLSSIDNMAVEVLYEDKPLLKTLFPEDYIVFDMYADFSTGKTEAKLLIANMVLGHGVVPTLAGGTTSNVTVNYLETDGYMPDLDQDKVKIDNPEKYRFIDFSSLGFNADTTEDIRKYAPLMYSLMRRAVTENDFKFLLESLPHFKGIGILPYKSQQGVHKLQVNVVDLDTFYLVTINGNPFQFQNTDPLLTADDITEILYQSLKSSYSVVVELIKDDVDGDWIKLTTISSRLLLTITTSSNLTLTELVEQKPAACCIMVVYYVKSDVIDDPVLLTHCEYEDVAAIVDYYRPVGLTLFYEEACRQDINLSFTVFLTDNSIEGKELITNHFEIFIARFNFSIDEYFDSYSIANEFYYFVNNKYGVETIERVIDNIPIDIYVDKKHYSKLIYELTFA